MPIPRWVAKANRRITNPVLGRLAPYTPGFGVVVHRGRKSEREYRTPVNVFRVSRVSRLSHDSEDVDRYVIPLTYGRESDWVKNVLAAGGCQLGTRGRTVTLGEPRLYHDERRSGLPMAVRGALGLLGVSDFLAFETVDAPPE